MMKYVKNKPSSVSGWGEYPEKRDLKESINRSLVIIDKPQGPSSHQISAWVKRIFDNKAAHSGTLDPNVTGVLPMGLGRAVRVLDLLHCVPKEYVVAVKFHGNVGHQDVKQVVRDFETEIYQTPPLKSGVKREKRKRKVHNIDILDYKKREYLLRVRCESGTYIRTLCKDIGKTLGVGAHMMELRRTESGSFTEEDMILLQDLKDAYECYKAGIEDELDDVLHPYEKALDIYPQIKVKDTAAGAVLNGADLAAPGILEMEDFSIGDKVVLVSQKNEGLAFGESLYEPEKIMEKDKGLVVKTERVFSPTGEYPKSWK